MSAAAASISVRLPVDSGVKAKGSREERLGDRRAGAPRLAGRPGRDTALSFPATKMEDDPWAPSPEPVTRARRSPSTSAPSAPTTACSAAGSAPPPVPRSSRPTPTVSARRRSRRRSRPRGAGSSSSPTSTRRSRCARCCPTAEIFVLNGLPPGAEAECARHRVTPVLNSLAQIDAWAALGRRLGRALPAALQVDSGMSRLGLGEAELDALAASPRRLAGIELRLVMSHLACAERQDHPMNREQLRRFEAARARLPPAPASLANSSGIFLGPDFHFDLARPGAALYGLAPVAGAANPMRPVVRLRGRIVQIREIAGRRGRRLRRQLARGRAAAHRHRRGRLRRRLPPEPRQPRHRLRRRHSRAARRHRLDGHRDLRRHRRARRRSRAASSS